LLRLRQPPALEGALRLLAYELSSCPQDVALVLDDYHSITNPKVHQAVDFLLAHLPPAVHLVILTRMDPPLPLPRLRARGQLVEIRAAHLRFTAEETAVFLNQVMGLGLSPADVTALELRTEGWAAGLQLAALSIQGREDPDGFVATFSGSHHYIVDYLVEEVLDRQPEAVRSFLLQTAVLARLTAPLCNALTGRTDSQTMLEQLEQANLFLAPLDDERRWYRYHHLFAEVLRSRLQQADPEGARKLLRRAAKWFAENELVYEAIQHALQARDFECAARLLGENWHELTHSYTLPTFARWMESFPEAVVKHNPRLGLVYGWVWWGLGQQDKGDRCVEQAEQSLEREVAAGQSSLDDPTVHALQAEITAYRASVAIHRRDLSAALELANQALETAPTEAPLARGLAWLNLFSAYSEMGQLEEATQACAAALRETRAAGNAGTVVDAIHNLGRLLVAQGQLHRASEVYREGLQYAQTHGQERIPAYSMVHFGLSDVLYEWNDLDTAERHIEQGLELCQLGGRLVEAQAGLIHQARLRRARGDWQGALAQIDQVAQQTTIEVFLEDAAFWRACLRAELGDLRPVTDWLKKAQPQVGERLGYASGVRALRVARMLILVGRLDEALDLLERIVRAAEASGALGWQVKALVQQALGWRLKGDDAQALAALDSVLTLAEPEGYARTLLDNGAPLIELLQQAGRAERAAGYAAQLLAAAAPAAPSTAVQHFLVEPLSERELEVLRLVAAGKSNRVIAEQLILAEGTIKKHLSNIFGKLEVHNRTACVARARELGLL
jgi:LuxR family maltose regulon positive regulatory protein